MRLTILALSVIILTLTGGCGSTPQTHALPQLYKVADDMDRISAAATEGDLKKLIETCSVLKADVSVLPPADYITLTAQGADDCMIGTPESINRASDEWAAATKIINAGGYHAAQ